MVNWGHSLAKKSRGIYIKLLLQSVLLCQDMIFKDELSCLFPEDRLLCCDVFAIQTVKQPMHGL